MKSLIILSVFLLSISAHAKNRTGQVTVGATLGPIIETPWDSDLAKSVIDIGIRGGLFARFNHDTNNAGFELAADALRLDSNISAEAFTFNFFKRYLVEQKIQPLFAIGVGVSHTHDFFMSLPGQTPGTSPIDLPVFRLRAGVDIDLNKNIDLGIYLDHFSIMKSKSYEANLHMLTPSIALLYSFGNTTQAAAAAPVIKAEEKLADNDSDGDGVMDSKDRCPGTAKGVEVNNLGCAKQQSFQINLDVKFKTSKATLESNMNNDIESVAAILKEHEDLKLELAGYTDNVGAASRNKTLSQERANAIKDVFVKKYKIHSDRLHAIGYGSENPIAPNSTSAGRALNRRVTATILR